jgi:tetratricopeptide (TPR) repeat protein
MNDLKETLDLQEKLVNFLSKHYSQDSIEIQNKMYDIAHIYKQMLYYEKAIMLLNKLVEENSNNKDYNPICLKVFQLLGDIYYELQFINNSLQ